MIRYVPYGKDKQVNVSLKKESVVELAGMIYEMFEMTREIKKTACRIDTTVFLRF